MREVTHMMSTWIEPLVKALAIASVAMIPLMLLLELVDWYLRRRR